MPREHARILTRIWDPTSDFRELDPDAQRVYFMLLSQRSLNHAGVLPLTVKKWANNCAATSTEDVWTALKKLDVARYIVVDTNTEEVLIRSFIRNDGVARQPNVLKAALRFASGVESPRLRAALAGELRRLGTDQASRVADELTGTEPIGKGSVNPSETLPSHVDNPGDNNPSGTVSEGFARDAGEGEGEVESVTSAGGQVLEKGPRPKPSKPIDRCNRHTHDPEPPPCRACRDARVAAAAWEAEQQAETRTAIRRCQMCDGEGFRWDPAGRHRGPTRDRCDHRPLAAVS
jgi:hypothetical protein